MGITLNKTRASLLRENQAGFGLMEVMIAAGLAMMVAYGTATVLENTKRGEQSLAQSLNSLDTRQYLAHLLSTAAVQNSNNCGSLFQNSSGGRARYNPASNVSANELTTRLVNLNNQPILQVGQVQNGMRVSAINIQDLPSITPQPVLVGSNPAMAHSVTLEVVWESLPGNLRVGSQSIRGNPITFTLVRDVATNNIVQCSNVAGQVNPELALCIQRQSQGWVFDPVINECRIGGGQSSTFGDVLSALADTTNIAPTQVVNSVPSGGCATLSAQAVSGEAQGFARIPVPNTSTPVEHRKVLAPSQGTSFTRIQIKDTNALLTGPGTAMQTVAPASAPFECAGDAVVTWLRQNCGYDTFYRCAELATPVTTPSGFQGKVIWDRTLVTAEECPADSILKGRTFVNVNIPALICVKPTRIANVRAP